MYTSLFWKDLLERLIATLATAFSGLLTTDLASGAIADFSGLPWEAYALALFVTGVLTIAKAFGALQKGNTVSPASFAPAAPDRPAIAEEHVDDDPGSERVL